MPGHYGNPSKAAEMMGHKRKKKSKAMAKGGIAKGIAKIKGKNGAKTKMMYGGKKSKAMARGGKKTKAMARGGKR